VARLHELFVDVHRSPLLVACCVLARHGGRGG
jgi:hypothetical protein